MNVYQHWMILNGILSACYDLFYENCFYVVRNNLPNIKVQLHSVAKFPNLFLAINYIIRLFELKSKEVFKITI